MDNVHRIFIGVGHGGSDPGALAYDKKNTEANINLTIGLYCKDELERHGIDVRISRNKDENDTTIDEVNECNDFNPDLAIDIHNNSSVNHNAQGAEIYHSVVGGQGKILAQNILNELVNIGQKNRGIKTKRNASGKDYFGFIRSTKCPAVIVENAFIDNQTDYEKIDELFEQEKFGVAIAKGILKTLGISYVEKTKTMYRVQVGAFSSKKNAIKLCEELSTKGYQPFIQEVK